MNILLSVNRRTPFIYRQFGLPTLSTTTAVQLYTNRSQQLINLKRWKHSDSKTIVSGIGGHPINVMSDENIKNCPRTKPRPKSLESLLNDNDILQEPEGTRIGLLKAIFVIILGLYIGAWLAMIGAYLLEELEIFVDDDNDDDDD